MRSSYHKQKRKLARKEKGRKMAKEKAVDVESGVPDTHIECAVCGSQYEKRIGSSNDCPSCNAPGGKGPDSAVDAAALKGMSGSVQQAFETVTRNVNLQSKRIADLENAVAVLREQVADLK